MSVARVTLENFKGHRLTEIPLGPLTVLVGGNSTGKTSVLEAIHLVASRVGTMQWYRTDLLAGEEVRQGTDGFRIRLDFQANADEFVEYGLRKRGDALLERCAWATKGQRGEREAELGGAVDATARQVLRQSLGERAPTYLALDPAALAAPSTLEVAERTTEMHPSGRGLAGVLAILRLFEPEAFDRVLVSLREVVPSLRQIHVVRSAFAEERYDGEDDRTHTVKVQGTALRFDFVGATDIPATQVSEGTLLALGLITAAYLAPEQHVILLDDLERGLHPTAQQALVMLLRKLLAERPQLQVVATSHSPYLLDALEHDEVRLTTLDGDGSVLCAPLRSHPEFDQWKTLVKPGELWMSGLEGWIRPVPEPVS